MEISTKSYDPSRVQPCLYDLLAKYLDKKSKPYIVQSLPVNISGITIFTKSPEAQKQMKSTWKENGIIYNCVTIGQPSQKSSTFSYNSYDQKSNRSTTNNIRYKVLRNILSSKGRINVTFIQ